MLRVLLLIDDYNEMVYIQTLLKKLGFDVVGIQNQKKFEDTALTFNPQVVLASARGRRVDGVAVGKSLRRHNGIPSLVLLKGAQPIKDSDLEAAQVDRVIDSPVNAQTLLSVLANIGGLDESAVLDKYLKMRGSLSPDEEGELHILKFESQLERGEPASAGPEKANSASSEALGESIQLSPSKMDSKERRQRFEKAIANTEKSEHSGFPRERIMEFHKKLRSEEKSEELEDLEAERQEFVKALFSKKK